MMARHPKPAPLVDAIVAKLAELGAAYDLVKFRGKETTPADLNHRYGRTPANAVRIKFHAVDERGELVERNGTIMSMYRDRRKAAQTSLR